MSVPLNSLNMDRCRLKEYQWISSPNSWPDADGPPLMLSPLVWKVERLRKKLVAAGLDFRRDEKEKRCTRACAGGYERYLLEAGLPLKVSVGPLSQGGFPTRKTLPVRKRGSHEYVGNERPE